MSKQTWAPGVQVGITAAVAEAVRRSLDDPRIPMAITQRRLMKVVAGIIWRDTTAKDATPGMISPVIGAAQQDAADAFTAAMDAAGYGNLQRPGTSNPYRAAAEKGKRSIPAASAGSSAAVRAMAAQTVLSEMASRKLGTLVSTSRGPSRRSLPVWRASLRMAAAITPRARSRARSELGRARLRANADTLMAGRRERLLAKHRKAVLGAWNVLTDSLDPHPLVRQFLADEQPGL